MAVIFNRHRPSSMYLVLCDIKFYCSEILWQNVNNSSLVNGNVILENLERPSTWTSSNYRFGEGEKDFNKDEILLRILRITYHGTIIINAGTSSDIAKLPSNHTRKMNIHVPRSVENLENGNKPFHCTISLHSPPGRWKLEGNLDKRTELLYNVLIHKYQGYM